VKLLFDQNLSRRHVGLLADAFPDSTYVARIGRDTAPDREIWSYPDVEHSVARSELDEGSRRPLWR
jgi:predicted nuclease of predicted toxin-antitoxin system